MRGLAIFIPISSPTVPVHIIPKNEDYIEIGLCESKQPAKED